jgi:hypothetical protein
MLNEKTNLLPSDLLEALQGGANGAAGALSLIKSVLTQAGLSSEQAGTLDLLLQLQNGSAEDDVIAPDASVIDLEPTGTDLNNALERELADLREANDTLASALGACSVCWGGNRDCASCGGRGRPGYALPDLALFKELVAPAVRRVCSRPKP